MGGAKIAHASSRSFHPSEPSNNEVEVNETEYTFNGITKILNENDSYYEVYGGYSNYDDVYDNKITIYSGNISRVCGGRSFYGNAYNNSVEIYGGKIIRVYGSYGNYTNSNNNKVVVYGGTIQDIFGGGVEIFVYYDQFNTRI